MARPVGQSNTKKSAALKKPRPAAAPAKPRRANGELALKEIRQYQKSTAPLIPFAAMKRLVKEILNDRKVDARIQGSAVLALQEGTEMYLVRLFEKAQMAAIHAGRVTIMEKDIQFVKRNCMDAI